MPTRRPTTDATKTDAKIDATKTNATKTDATKTDATKIAKTTKGAQSTSAPGRVDSIRAITLKNPSSFDPFAYWSEAEAIATSVIGDNLYRGMTTWWGVDRNGRLDIAGGDSAIYHFVSRDRIDAGDVNCVVMVMIQSGAAGESSAAIVRAQSLDGCKHKRVLPRCTMAQIWAKANALGAPPEGDAILNRISSRTWKLTIQKPTAWSESIDDDCE